MKISLKTLGMLGILNMGVSYSLAMAEEAQGSALDTIIELSESPAQRLQNTLLIGDWFLEQNNEELAKTYYQRGLDEYEGDQRNAIYVEALLKVAGLEKDKLVSRALLLDAKTLIENDVANELLYANVLEALVWTYDIENKDIQTVTNLLETAISIRKKYPYNTDYGATLRMLAWTYETRNLLSQAEYYYNYALNNDMKYLGFGDIRTVLAMENLAQFYLDFGQFDKAKRILDQKYELHMSAKARDHYNLARTESMLGWILVQTGHPKAAEKMYLDALKNVNQSLTKSADQLHYFSLSALFDLIYFYVSQDDFERALDYYEQAQTVVAQTDGLTLREYVGALGQSGMEELASSYAWSIHAQYNSIQRLHEYLNSRNKN
ncbi:tetratricopeptide repeat protein [Wohlfahrtiimonas chitiniclastica]|uniref:tetratricopeptide repeat protein n=1 Tax=Wohlfahrtiimonas chitiniclastica TaxID=400946 RepID=UPI001FEF51EE|nr:tetratricopeptide repeat protein [Wohlfahrtiimonas chitiniclastica]